MDRDTVAVYEARAEDWRDAREARFLDRAALLSASVRNGGPVADLGCGAGLHLPYLPRPAVALDAAYAMVELARQVAADVPGVAGDLETLPLRRGALGGVWARASYLHIARDRLPQALAELHHALAVDAYAHFTMMPGEGEGSLPDDDFAGRFFARWQPDELGDVLVGAGLEVVDLTRAGGAGDGWI
ncbi:MAG: class I SAM-dependent methyltransferase, partial [Acidimicrobiia bacterium]